MSTFCNPLNLSYRYQNPRRGKDRFREAADPSLVMFNDEYWLFASKSGGYWRSNDLCTWSYLASRVLPVEDYAPDVRVIDEWLYFTASRASTPCDVFRTRDPSADDWEKVSTLFAYTDPNLFGDDDGRVYLYWGCSDTDPIHGIELEPGTMVPLESSGSGESPSIVDLLGANTAERGWERAGEDNIGGSAPWIEGPWMTKHSGRYYLQYAGPGTQYNVYGDGVYVGDAPLGPFACAPHNPFSFKPGGFISGAGHGSTFADRYGNLWHISTMRISVKHMFERRIGLFPAGFDSDGHLFCNTSFGDYPIHLPTGKWDPWKDPSMGWTLLSYGSDVSATASSAAPGHDPGLAINEDVRTFWAASGRGPGEWLQVDMGSPVTPRAVQINFAEHGCHYEPGAGRIADSDAGSEYSYPLRGGHRYLVETSLDGEEWVACVDQHASGHDTPHAYVELREPPKARFIRLTCHEMPASGVPAVSGLRVFGIGDGEKPEPVTAGRLRANRSSEDPCSVSISWDAGSGENTGGPDRRIQGYNVWWGIAADKLYSSWMVYGAESLTMHCLNGGLNYWLRVDSFNRNGVTQGEVITL